VELNLHSPNTPSWCGDDLKKKAKVQASAAFFSTLNGREWSAILTPGETTQVTHGKGSWTGSKSGSALGEVQNTPTGNRILTVYIVNMISRCGYL
jgi:hypothetical protein